MIALYCRVSGADGDFGSDGRDESNSIENQRLLTRSFINSKEELRDKGVREYVDDGFAGSDFCRPAFKRMIEDVKKGRVDTIVVKDLSRFGRDYIGVGEYLEEIFPLLGIRFIAVTDRYDSKECVGGDAGFEMAVSNLVNAMYSIDSGKRLYFANRLKWQSGCSTSGKVPFGYMADTERKGRYALDCEAGKIVRRIFDLAIEGKGCGRIASALNDEGIPIASEYNRKNKVKGKERQAYLNPDKIWDANKVRRILRNEVYTGTMIVGRLKKVGKGQRLAPKSEWFCTPDAHEAIVSREEFERAQLVVRKRQAAGMEKGGYPLKGIIRCGHCRCAMEYGKSKKTLWCRSGREQPEHSKCCADILSCGEIEEKVLGEIKKYISSIKAMEEKIKIMRRFAAKSQQSIKRNYEAAEQILNNLKAEKLKAYKDYAEGLAEPEQYIKVRTRLDREMEVIKGRMSQAEGEPENAADLMADFQESEKQARIFASSQCLTREMAEAFLEAVYVHEGCRLEIIFKFDGIMRELDDIWNKSFAEKTDDAS